MLSDLDFEIFANLVDFVLSFLKFLLEFCDDLFLLFYFLFFFFAYTV